MLAATPENSPPRQRSALNVTKVSNVGLSATDTDTAIFSTPTAQTNPAPAPQLPVNWHSTSADDRTTLIMQTLLTVQHQNTKISTDLHTLTNKLDLHSETLDRHEQDIMRLSNEQTDMQHAYGDRNPTSELVISSVPMDLTVTPD